MRWNRLYSYMTSFANVNVTYRRMSSRKIHEAFKRDSGLKRDWKYIGARGVFLISIPFGTFCLGTWQVSRLKWKLKLIEDLQSLTKQPPINLPENLEKLKDLEYRKVLLKGEFDHSKEIYLGPRPQIFDGDINQMDGGMLSSGQSGYNVITPFTLSDRNLTILVNRGWVSRKLKNPEKRLEGQVAGEVSLTGIVRNNESRSPFMPENHWQNETFSYRDVVKMSELTGSSPIFVDAVETFKGGPAGGQTRVTLRNEHLSYIITW
ncbi:Surfeit locus protein 1 [Armadillidium vulgare]|nr:Surfeit locus protein 1 [Armadillidium vulgare]